MAQVHVPLIEKVCTGQSPAENFTTKMFFLLSSHLAFYSATNLQDVEYCEHLILASEGVTS